MRPAISPLVQLKILRLLPAYEHPRNCFRTFCQNYKSSVYRVSYLVPATQYHVTSPFNVKSVQPLFGSVRFKFRLFSVSTFSAQNSVQNIQLKGEELFLFVDGKQFEVPLLWLRDHCRCPMCYNFTTYQKNVDQYSLNSLAVLEMGANGDTLSMKWQDGHTSQYNLQWLVHNFCSAVAEVERFLWDGLHMSQQELPTTAYEDHISSDDGLKNTLRHIIKYGFCVVNGTPVSEKGTEDVARRISIILETVYGTLNVMVSGIFSGSDTAYTNLPLGAHTDLTYYTLPAGIQVFHCLHHNGEGGQTLLVDGFHAAKILRRNNPPYFEILRTTAIPHEYIDGTSYHLYSLGTVLSTDVLTGALVQIRFNPYDRAPLSTVLAEDILPFYNSYSALTDIIRSKERAFWFKLEPGMVLLVDNWRVLHGRSGFTGKRVMCGCYLPRDEWTSRARVMGLL